MTRSHSPVALLLVIFSLAALRPAAVSAAGLMDVEVLVPDQSSQVQQAAFTRGLEQVLVRLAGDAGVLSRLQLPPARPYVKQFRYDKPDADAGGEIAIPGVQQQLLLLIQYDEERLATLLRNNDIPVWSTRRDQAVLWLAVRDGGQRYLLKQADESQIKTAVETAGMNRGLPLVWPRHDASDRRQVRIADVWGGFDKPLQQASRRYSSGPVIAANMAWTGSGWSSEWFLIDGRERGYWAFNNVDYASLISQAIDAISNDLGKRYAVLDEGAAATQARQLLVELQGVASVQDYQRAQTILSEVTAVSQVQPFEVRVDSVIFAVALRSDEQDLLDRLSRHRELRQLLQVPIDLQPLSPPTQPLSEGDAPTATGAVSASRPLADYRFELLAGSRDPGAS